jgi:EAL domain-containing protein (putative c-di-GMP-specific phosphodiesterase class I)
VVEQVCKDYHKVIENGDVIVPASINFSCMDFELCDIFGKVDEIRRKYDVPINMIDLEITETAIKDNPGKIQEECRKMRAKGYQVWLDDFGSGYSSLNNVVEYEFDVLKMDMVFLRNYDKYPKTATIMKYIANGARSLGVLPLCEGVETEEHYEFLKSINCDKAQGYYFGKPMPMEETKAHTKGKGMEWETEEERIKYNNRA